MAELHRNRVNDHKPRLRILITGGGTGGHVYPGLAVAEALLAERPDSEIRFAGTRSGLEFLVVPKAGFRLHTIPASGFRGLGSLARIRFLLNFFTGLICSLWLLLMWRPAVILGTGGYVSAPVLVAARLLRCSCVLQEQNAMPGSANRLLARWAKRIYLGFAEAAAQFPGRSRLFTGNPVRASFSAGSVPPASEKEVPPRLSVEAALQPMHVLIFGGSRGARTLNNAVIDAAAKWLDEPALALWIQTGTAQNSEVAVAYAHFPGERVKVAAYLFNMAAALAWADLAVCRAGAMTLAELQAMGKPAVLVPFPHATDDHQLRNAKACEKEGAAVVIVDADCSGDVLVAQVAELAHDRERLAEMSRGAASLARPEAARTIARDLLRVAAGDPLPEGAEAGHVS